MDAKRPLETLRTGDALTQDMMSAALQVIENAMQSGAGWARVQLLRQRYNHFHYVSSATATFADTLTFPVHDAQTLVALASGSRQRAQLSRPVLDIIHWLRGLGVQVLCTTSATQTVRLHGEPALAPWLYLVAVFVPQGEGESEGRLRYLWNTHYMPKCLDDSALAGWAQRCQRALTAGASHCALCTLYRDADFSALALASAEDSPYTVVTPRHHLTMQPLASSQWVLDKRFKLMVGFAHSYGYAWTLCMPGAEGPWAYFTMLLDPLSQYEQLSPRPGK